MFEIEKIHYNLNLLDLLYNYQLITNKQFIIIKKLKKYYSNYTEGKTIPSYNNIRIQGGKIQDKFEENIDKSKYWLKMLRLYKNYKIDLNDFTNDLFLDKQVFYFIGFYKNKFYDFLYFVINNVDIITKTYFKIVKKNNKKF